MCIRDRAGDEQTIVYEVTGNVVPPGGIPLNCLLYTSVWSMQRGLPKWQYRKPDLAGGRIRF